MGNQEVERKWLVGEVPAEVLAVEGESIDQGYLAVEEDGGEVRLRRRAGRFYLTAKAGSGLVRRELEVEISADQFDALWPGTEGRRIEKTRRVVELGESGNLCAELDEYAGSLAGLRVVEVEFPGEEAAGSFRAPAWFEDEVTECDEYRNRSLAVLGLPGAGK